MFGNNFSFQTSLFFLQLNLQRIHTEFVVIQLAWRRTLTSNIRNYSRPLLIVNTQTEIEIQVSLFCLLLLAYLGWNRRYCDMQWNITITTQSKNKESWEKRKNKTKNCCCCFCLCSNTNNYVVGLGYTVAYYL